HLLPGLLLPAADWQWPRSRPYEDQGLRAGQHRIPVRAFPVRHGLGACIPLHPQGEHRLRPAGGKAARASWRREGWRRTMNLTLALFLIVVAVTLGITAWAARRATTTVQFWAAGRQIKGWQNGLAIAGDYMSAASFLGIAGLIAFNGYDGFMYSVGWLVAYLLVLFLIAEPMRHTGKYTMADTLASRMRPIPVRSAAAVATIAVSAAYMMAQMVGAGSLVKILIPTLDANLKPYFQWSLFGIHLDPSITLVGILMMVYVSAGGMVATTWVQIVKAVLLMAGAVFLSL